MPLAIGLEGKCDRGKTEWREVVLIIAFEILSEMFMKIYDDVNKLPAILPGPWKGTV